MDKITTSLMEGYLTVRDWAWYHAASRELDHVMKRKVVQAGTLSNRVN